MKKIIKLLPILSIFLFTTFNGQTGAIGEAPLDLENFDFQTKIETLFPPKNESKLYKNYYMISGNFISISFEKDSTFVNRFSENQKATGFQYLQKSSSNADTLAIFKNQIFNRMNLATNLKNEIIVVSTVADEMTEEQNKNFIKILTSKYGKYKKAEREFDGKFFIYEWQNKDQIIKYSTVFNDENNTLKIEVSENKITSADNEPHFEGYLYLIKKEYLSEIKNLNSGDFVFIDE